MNTIDKYARICSVSNNPMNEGWMDSDTAECFSTQSIVIEHIKNIIKQESLINEIDPDSVSNKQLLSYACDNLNIFWTTWDIDPKEGYYTSDGVHHKN
jgi:hypothetical protein